MHQSYNTIKIIKLINGDDIVCVLPADQLPPSEKILRMEKPLQIKYVPQMTPDGLKDYIALIKWAAYTPDKIISVPMNKIITITNASKEMERSYKQLSKTYDDAPIPTKKQSRYKQERFDDDENDEINEIWDQFKDISDTKH